MKKIILRIFFISIIIYSFIINISLATGKGTAWESTDYTSIDVSTATQKLLDLADPQLENKKDAEKWQKKYKQVQKCGKDEYKDEDYWFKFVNGQGRNLNSNFKSLNDEANKLIKGTTSGSNTTYYKDTWSNWLGIPLSEFQNVATAGDANILYDFIVNSPIKTENMSKETLQDYIRKMDALKHSPGFIILDGQQNGECLKGLDSIYREINGNQTLMDKIAGTEERDIIEKSPAANNSAGGNKTSTTIYSSRPEKSDEQHTAGDSLDDMISDADSFVNEGSVTYQQDKLSDVSNIIYNILLSVGVMIAVIIGAIIGVKLMISSGVDKKVEAKQLLVPYVVGCVVVFGGFGIWKLLVQILQGL